jgi:glycerophosphoryl diester phosphodiesterase
MKSIVILFLLQFSVSCIHCVAQNNAAADVYLTNYTISKGTNEIGYVRVKSGKIKSVTIEGEHRALVKIDKRQKLSIQPDVKQEADWFDITLNVKTSSEQWKRVFRIVKDDFIRNKVIAHRGAWKNTGAPENSIEAFDHAVKLGCEGSEFDVHMSADSLPVVNHDPLIQGVSIAKSNANQLLQIKLSNGETLPTLEEYVKRGMSQNKTKLILELKPAEVGKEHSIALARKAVALVESLHAQAWVDYISFDYDVCKEVMKLAPYAKVAYLKGDKSPDELAADKLFGLDYNFSVLQKNPGWIKEAKSKNLTVNVWTVNDRPLLEDLLKQNVDFITTNEPELLLSMVK